MGAGASSSSTSSASLRAGGGADLEPANPDRRDNPVVTRTGTAQRTSSADVGPGDQERRLLDLDVTPKATARKDPSRPPLPPLPMPDFSESLMAIRPPAAAREPTTASSSMVMEDRSEDTLSPLPNEVPLPSVTSVTGLIRERRSSGGGSSSAVHQPRSFKKRMSIAPFPTAAPQTLLLVQDTPVTARVRTQGDGKAKRYSLMLGGTIRGGPGGGGGFAPGMGMDAVTSSSHRNEAASGPEGLGHQADAAK